MKETLTWMCWYFAGPFPVPWPLGLRCRWFCEVFLILSVCLFVFICVTFVTSHWKNLRSSSTATATAKSLQSCPTLCDPVDCSLLGSSIHGIFQTRILEWVDISYSGESSDPGIEPLSPASPCIGRQILYNATRKKWEFWKTYIH